MDLMDVCEEGRSEKGENSSVISALEYMPDEVLVEVFKLLDWRSLCRLSQTCTKFRSVCLEATVWSQLKYLDFRDVPVPLSEKILGILKRTPKAVTLYLGSLIVEPSHASMEDEEEEEEENVVGADKCLLDVLTTCQHLRSLHLREAGVGEITDRSVEAITAKCTELMTLSIHDNDLISEDALTDLVSYLTTLRKLQIKRCSKVHFPTIRHKDASRSLAITEIRLNEIKMLTGNVQSLLQGCPKLVTLNLKGVQYLSSFPTSIPAGTASGLDSLKTLSLCQIQELEKVEISYAPNLEYIDISKCSMLNQLSLQCPKLSTLLTKGSDQLEEVKIPVCDLTELHLNNLGELRRLEVTCNHLSVLDLSGCSRLTSPQLISSVQQLRSIRILDVSGCNISTQDLSIRLLPQLSSLERLIYGERATSAVSLASNSLQHLTFKDSTNCQCLPLNMPSLQTLTLINCRDLVEHELIDSLLYGRQITRMLGLEKLIEVSEKEPPFVNGVGTPKLQVLSFHSLPGIHGDKLSSSIKHFSWLNKLEIVKSAFLAQLTVQHCPSLTNLRIESCTRLSNICVQNLPCLQMLDIKWCSLVSQASVISDTVKQICIKGSNFSHATFHCDQLQALEASGLLTQTENTFSLKCKDLRKLSIQKCDRLTDEKLVKVLKHVPNLREIDLIGSLSLRHCKLPSSVEVCLLTGHRVFHQITIPEPVHIRHLMLNNLPKFMPSDRQALLKKCEKTLKVLSLRAIPRETTLQIKLSQLTYLCLDQGIHLTDLEIKCPNLEVLRIQGCPKLLNLSLHVRRMSQLRLSYIMEENVFGIPLYSLRNLNLHTSQVFHLADTLAHYCLNIEKLSIHGCKLQTNQLHALVTRLTKLTTVLLVDCVITELPTLNDNSHGTLQGAHITRQGQTVTLTIPR